MKKLILVLVFFLFLSPNIDAQRIGNLGIEFITPKDSFHIAPKKTFNFSLMIRNLDSLPFYNDDPKNK